MADENFDQALLDKHPDGFDALVLPGGVKGSEHFQQDKLLIQTLEKYLKDQTKIVGVLCASPAIVLNECGLLIDKPTITSYPSFKDAFSSKSCTWVDKPVVRDGNLITSQGPGTTIEFGITMVDALWGAQMAKSVKQGLICKGTKGFFENV